MKRIYLIIFFVVFVISANAQTPNWRWANGIGSVSAEEGTAIATDSIGNTYITGFFIRPTPGPDTTLFGSTPIFSMGASDIYIAKYDSIGNLIWATSAGGTLDDISKGIAVDPSGNVYLTGYFNSPSITFDTISLSTTLGNDLFIAKYNSSGHIIWAKNAGGSSGDYSNSIAVDANGNSFITGYFNSATIQFGGTTLSNPYSTSGGYNYFVAKYDLLGNNVWAKAAIGSTVTGNSIKVNSNGNIFISGFFAGTATFDTISKTSMGSKDIFIAKYDALGTALWVNNVGGSYEDIASAMGIDANGNSYVTGYFKSNSVIVGSTTLTNSGPPDGDVLLIKYDALGTALWAKKAINYSNDMALAIAVDPSGNSYVTGFYNGSILKFGTITLNSASATTNVGDLFVVKYNTAGTALWAKNLVASIGARGYGISLDASGNCYLTGFFEDVTLSFDTITLVHAGNLGQRDAFVGKIGTATSVGLPEYNSSYPILVYPNPTTNNIVINLNNTSTSQIEILNMVGEVVYRSTTVEQQTKVDLSLQPKGIYIIRIVNSNSTVTNRKILIQ